VLPAPPPLALRQMAYVQSPDAAPSTWAEVRDRPTHAEIELDAGVPLVAYARWGSGAPEWARSSSLAFRHARSESFASTEIRNRSQIPNFRLQEFINEQGSRSSVELDRAQAGLNLAAVAPSPQHRDSAWILRLRAVASAPT
jgi:hypothetical protein